MALFLLDAVGPQARAGNDNAQSVTVSERRGVYSIAATFTVNQPSELAYAVLTDYPAIPRYMPEVQTSLVLERAGSRAVVEQEAVARFMMFSRRIHLVLDVVEEPSAIRFHDVCGKSFIRYEGAWQIEPANGGTQIRYALTAKPAFAVPGFLLQRLLKRDATNMIAGLQAEIVRRSKIAGATHSDD
jgi:uncharacterized membrane protein